jgi:antitoxin ChpS
MARKHALFARLRKVGGSVMLAVPPGILELLNLQAGSAVELTMSGGRLLVTPARRYTLEELVAQCDPSAGISDEDREWHGGRATGSELL